MRARMKAIGMVAYYFIWLIKSTVRLKRVKHPSFDPTRPVLYCFWHGDMLLPIISVKQIVHHRVAGFASVSKDGDIVSCMLEKLGYEVVRGSTSKKAVAGLVKLVQCAKQGYSLGITPDGPRGPRHHVSKGLAFVAAKSKMPIVPIGTHLSRKKVFEKSWDQFVLPRMFAKATLYFGEPFYVEKVDEQAEQLIKAKIDKAAQLAKIYAQGEPTDEPIELLSQ